jgi:hypothetical protein
MRLRADFRLRQLQWSLHIAISAAEFATAAFDLHELHRLLTLRASGSRGIFGHYYWVLLSGSQSEAIPDDH